jgi:predicted regulator of Ras-like GTPase activity (Roadblock/LC7/MglB family)
MVPQAPVARPPFGSFGRRMDASAALSELVGLSTQVVEAVVTTPDGTVAAARTADDERARRLGAAGAELLAEASSLRPEAAVSRVHVDLERGSLVAVSDGRRAIVATTVPEPTAGLVAFDLRTALQRIGEDGA